jgi:hypothetical protein
MLLKVAELSSLQADASLIEAIKVCKKYVNGFEKFYFV